jgi:protein TonB
MRLTAFLFISLSLHAAVLTYPALFFEQPVQDGIPVIILDTAEPSGEKNGDGHAEGKKGGQPVKPRHFVPAQRISATKTEEKRPAPESKAPREIVTNSVDVPAEIVTASIFAATQDAIASFSTQQGNGSGDGGSGGQGNSGSGLGSGAGSDNGNGTAKFVQAAYAYSPKPDYPDSARREGKQGRVILRILVDEKGRSKSVEVNRSSGSQALDQAAANVMKRWRFSPAHWGDTPVESWIKIPIDFQLTDAKD